MAADIDPEIDARVADLLDKHAISECIIRFTRGMDRHDVELFRSSCWPDAVDDHGAFIGSAYDLIDWANNFDDEAYSSHQHYLSNVHIDLAGDEAHVETYVMFVGCIKGTSTIVTGGGRYLDRLERRDGEWRIADRVMIAEWWSNPSGMEQMNALGVPFSQDRSDPSYVRPLRVNRPHRIPGADRTAGASE